MARGRATVDRNHIVRSAQGNTNTHQVPSQDGDVCRYSRAYKYREQGVLWGRWVGEECFCQAEKTGHGACRCPQSREVPASEFWLRRMWLSVASVLAAA